MPRRRKDPNRCGRGHDIGPNSDNRYESPSGKLVCRTCQAEAVRRHRRAHRPTPAKPKSPPKLHYYCAECGKPKFADARRLCLPCKFEARRSAAHEEVIADAVVLESAPAWVRRLPLAEQRQWCRDNRSGEHRRLR